MCIDGSIIQGAYIKACLYKIDEKNWIIYTIPHLVKEYSGLTTDLRN